MAEKKEKSCFNCTHVNVCKYFDKIEKTAKTMYGMFDFGEDNHIDDDFAKHSVGLCKHYSPMEAIVDSK